MREGRGRKRGVGVTVEKGSWRVGIEEREKAFDLIIGGKNG